LTCHSLYLPSHCHTSPLPLPAALPISAVTPLDHLRVIEAESIHIFREVVAEFDRPVMLYSIGKDSSVLLRLAQKAFYPGPIPFPDRKSTRLNSSHGSISYAVFCL